MPALPTDVATIGMAYGGHRQRSS